MAMTAPGTPAWLRARNSRAALDLLLRSEPLSRTRLGELLGLSKPTAAQIVAQLESAGLIRAMGQVSGGRGPNAVTYGVVVGRARGVAIDVREDQLCATVVDPAEPAGASHPLVQVPTAAVTSRPAAGIAGRSPETDVRAAIHAACVAADLDDDAISAVTIGVQAGVARGGDLLDFTDTLPGWPAEGARVRIERTLGVDAELANDVDLAAAAEAAVGAARDVARAALLWLGDGIGSALLVDGRVLQGSAGGAGEIGYLPAPASTRDLDPAAEDLTDLAGGPGIRSLLDRHRIPSLADALGDPEARGELAERIALAAAPVLAVADPELLVIAGPTATAGGATLALAVEAHLAGASRWAPRVVASTVDEPVLTGARSLLLESLRNRLVSTILSP